jgi:hypothetical protein
VIFSKTLIIMFSSFDVDQSYIHFLYCTVRSKHLMLVISTYRYFDMLSVVLVTLRKRALTLSNDSLKHNVYKTKKLLCFLIKSSTGVIEIRICYRLFKIRSLTLSLLAATLTTRGTTILSVHSLKCLLYSQYIFGNFHRKFVWFCQIERLTIQMRR